MQVFRSIFQTAYIVADDNMTRRQYLGIPFYTYFPVGRYDLWLYGSVKKCKCFG